MLLAGLKVFLVFLGILASHTQIFWSNFVFFKQFGKALIQHATLCIYVVTIIIVTKISFFGKSENLEFLSIIHFLVV